MNKRARQDDEQFQLWQHYLAQSRDGNGTGQTGLDPNLLASYLDGTADAAEIEQVEARLAADPDLLEEVRELRSLASNPELQQAPESLLLRAKALVSTGEGTGPQELRLIIPHVRRPWLQRLQWMAAAAAVVVASLGGYSFGRETYNDRTQANLFTTAGASLLIEEVDSEPGLQIGQNNGGNGGGQ